MDPIVLAAIAELAKLGMMYLIANAKQAGLTDEQLDKLYNDTKTKFLKNDPANIPN